MKVILIALDKTHTKMEFDAELIEARVPILIPEPASRWRMIVGEVVDVSFRTFIYSGELDGLPIYKEAEGVDKKESIETENSSGVVENRDWRKLLQNVGYRRVDRIKTDRPAQ